MWGAIIGDIVGSVYEFSGSKIKDFKPLFSPDAFFTDDTVCTVALADCLLNDGNPSEYLRRWCIKYPNRGYGLRFLNWLHDPSMGPYESYGNGSAMRVSSVPLISKNLAEAADFTDLITYPTHNHIEGLKGAQAVTEAIWLGYEKASAAVIREKISTTYEYDLSKSIDQIRPGYTYNETCQDTVPQAIICALESTSFEDAIRNAVSLGGDADTLACIAGSIAEALFSCPIEFIEQAKDKLSVEMVEIVNAAYQKNKFLKN